MRRFLAFLIVLAAFTSASSMAFFTGQLAVSSVCIAQDVVADSASIDGSENSSSENNSNDCQQNGISFVEDDILHVNLVSAPPSMHESLHVSKVVATVPEIYIVGLHRPPELA